MVDDILSIQRCSDASLVNAEINAFIEMKCKRIHIKRRRLIVGCAELKIHGEKMKNSNQEKYLGDIVDRSGSIKPTISDSISKG